MRSPSGRSALLGVAVVVSVSAAGSLTAVVLDAVTGETVRGPAAVAEAPDQGGPGAAGGPGAPAPAGAPGMVSSVTLSIPAVGLELPVLPLTPAAGAIDPPTLTEAYWVEPYGDPVGDPAASDNTLYIAGHTWGGGDAAFNPLLDDSGQRGALTVGDAIEVRTPTGTAEYTVTGTESYARGALPSAADVWEASPGRLVLISCLQREDGPPTENVVVVAES